MAQEKRQIRRVAQKIFGHERLCPGQGEAVQALLDGHDTLVVMPTGQGKSAIYQIAGLLQVIDALPADETSLTPQTLSTATDLSQLKVNTALQRLAELKWVEILPTGEVKRNQPTADFNGGIEQAVSAQGNRQQFKQSRLELLRRYVAKYRHFYNLDIQLS